MEKCFIIQPFDNSKFDKRFHDVFEPAIKRAGLDPYRVDRDYSVGIPINSIEEGILESSMCFAEISTNNPNVWYELGYAFACKKDVVMVCSDERTDNFPFDIQHRQILTYSTSSKSDFETLESTITQKILALKQKSTAINKLNLTPVVETEGLKSHEIAFLILLIQNQFLEDNTNSIWYIQGEMGKAGYTEVATSVALRTLRNKGFVDLSKAFEEDYRNGPVEYPAVKVTALGEKWVLEHQEQLVFRKDKTNENINGPEDLPF